MREPIVRTAFYHASAALAVLILVAGAMPSIAAAKTVEIKMTDTPPKFMPMLVTIQKGDTVEWINNAQSLHSVTTNPAVAQDPKDVSAPKDAKPRRVPFVDPELLDARLHILGIELHAGIELADPRNPFA